MRLVCLEQAKLTNSVADCNFVTMFMSGRITECADPTNENSVSYVSKPHIATRFQFRVFILRLRMDFLISEAKLDFLPYDIPKPEQSTVAPGSGTSPNICPVYIRGNGKYCVNPVVVSVACVELVAHRVTTKNKSSGGRHN